MCQMGPRGVLATDLDLANILFGRQACRLMPMLCSDGVAPAWHTNQLHTRVCKMNTGLRIFGHIHELKLQCMYRKMWLPKALHWYSKIDQQI